MRNELLEAVYKKQAEDGIVSLDLVYTAPYVAEVEDYSPCEDETISVVTEMSKLVA